MENLSLRLVTALMCFTLGVFATSVWRNWQSKNWFSGSPQTLPYCEVARNGEHYHNQIIRVRATLILGRDYMYIVEDCDPVEALMALVEMNGATITDNGNDLDRFLKTIGSNSSHKKFNVIIEGTFNARASMGCFGPKYHIAATKVELLTPTTNYMPPLNDDEWACG